jgi:hypothetical protein
LIPGQKKQRLHLPFLRGARKQSASTKKLGMRMLPQLILAFALAAAGFGTAWQIQSWRLDAKESEHAIKLLAGEKLATETALRHAQALSDAQSKATARAAALRRDADGARSALDGLRDATATAMQIARTNHAACVERADAFGVVLGTMAKAGGELAAKADRHASDAQTLSEAWPK